MTEIKNIMWKNLEAIQLENACLRVVVLPELGGKLVSVYGKRSGFELAAAHKGETYQIPEYGADFSQYDASGLDDTFPNIGMGEIETEGKKRVYPDHGEVWSSPMEARREGEALVLSFLSREFDYTYQKKIRLEENKVCLSYEIENLNPTPFPCIWTYHGLVRYEEDMEIIYDEDVKAFRNVLEGPGLGKEGTIYPIQNERYDFTKVPPAKPETMVKYYAEGKMSRGFCGLRYPTQKAECRYYYDAQRLPYLGVWITAGGFRGDYNCALEMSNGFYDDIHTAGNNGALYFLEKETPLCFDLTIELVEKEDGAV